VSPKPWQTNTNHFALVVGINDYSRYNPLKGPIADAEDFIRWLCDETDGGGLPDDNCRRILCVSKPGDPEAVQDRIDDEFEHLMRLVKGPDPAQRLYVYFSGHGIAPARLATGMCASNWDESWGKDRALNSQQYMEALLQSGRFLEVIMFLDCCRVRLVSSRGRGPAGWPVNPQNSGRCKQFQAEAAQFTNKAYEAAIETQDAPAPLVRGYFTRALLTALRGAAAVPAGGVPATTLKGYLESEVPRLALIDGYVQEPEIANGLPANPEPVFGKAKPGGPPSSVQPDGGSPVSPASPRGPLLSADLLSRIPGGTTDGPTLFRLRSVASSKTRGTTTKTQPVRQVRLKKPEIVSLTKSFSATPMITNTATPDPYARASERWSRAATRPPLSAKSNSSLFIFIRTVGPSKSEEGVRFFEQLELRNSRGAVVSHFPQKQIQSSVQEGWAAFHAAVPTGEYYLRYKGTPHRDIPMELFTGWQTQLFFMFRTLPLFETLKIFIERRGFRPQDQETRICDLALNGLQNHQDLLEPKDLRVLLYGKFQNPMLGIVAAHILLQKQGVPPGIETILSNLDRLLPESIDVAALILLAQSRGIRFDQMRAIGRLKRKRFRFEHPPMLRMSLDAIAAASCLDPSLIDPESDIPVLVTRLFADSPWTNWQSIGPATAEFQPNWVHAALLSDVRARMKQRKGEFSAFDKNVFARQIGVTPETIRLAVSELDKANMRQIAEMFPGEFPEGMASATPKKPKHWFSGMLNNKPALAKKGRQPLASSNNYSEA
jgi:Caspase domain